MISGYTNAAKDAIDSGWISNHGKYLDLVSKMFTTMFGIPYCILTNNGTSSTHCLFIALKYVYPDVTKIYVPNNVFVAPWNCGIMEFGTSTFEVLKTDMDSMNMCTDEEYVKSLDKNSAVLIVHNLGNIVNVPRLKRIRPDLIFIEDNCEGIFGKYEGIYSGTFSGTLCSSVSFYANKTITSGEGGAFFTHNKNVYDYIRTYCNHGMSNERYIHNILGNNFRMTNIQAAILYDQLSDIDTILRMKSDVMKSYHRLIEPLKSLGVIHLKQEPEVEISNWMFCVLFKVDTPYDYMDVERFFMKHGIQIRPLFYDYRRHKHLSMVKCKDDIIVSNGIFLPSYPHISLEKQIFVIDILRLYLQKRSESCF